MYSILYNIRGFHFSLWFVVVLLLAESAMAQESKWHVGVGTAYSSYINKLGFNINVTYRIADNFFIGPDASFYLPNDLRKQDIIIKEKEVDYNFNVHHVFNFNSKFSIYPVVGINFSKVTHHPENGEAHVRWVKAFNSGGGIEYNLVDARLFMEGKWVSELNKADFVIGLVIIP